MITYFILYVYLRNLIDKIVTETERVGEGQENFRDFMTLLYP